ncbi:MAG: ABC transporter permease [Acidobacteria bacterium]|nr:ABC transporter permease [Acidobacteriota bacterium]
MPARFELFVARRYLRAKRKQAVISVITVISVLGVAAGVMSLVIALAINNGFRNTLQRNLLSATADVTLLEKEPGFGIENWRELAGKLRQAPRVVSASPSLYGAVFLSGPLQAEGAVLKGVELGGGEAGGLLGRLREGSVEGLRSGDPPGIILGARLAEKTGMRLRSLATVISPQGNLTPLGPWPKTERFRVAGIFESGFYDVDVAWAFASLGATQRLLGLEDVVNAIELKIDDLYKAPEVARAVERMAGPKFAATTWMEQNRQIFNALRMEKAVTWVTIGLIVLVAALNILITLVMMVMEKYRDIAVLMSMGARREQIRRIFMFQGVLIGAVGALLGLAAGYTLSFLADRHRWIRLDESVYALSYVPFDPRWVDGLWIAAAALLVSFLATLYPARSAARIPPAEALRYE